MKKIFLLIGLLLTIGCFNLNQQSDDIIKSNGFIMDTEQKIMLASEDAVNLFKAIDKAWLDRDYNKIKSLVAKDATLRFANGEKGEGPDDLINLIEKEYQENLENGVEWGWNTEYAFAVKNSPTDDPKPGDIGEWVLAEFTNEKLNIIEWYQFNDGKLINWYQFNAPLE